MYGRISDAMKPHPPRVVLLSDSYVRVSAPYGTISARGTTVFVPGVLDFRCMK